MYIYIYVYIYIYIYTWEESYVYIYIYIYKWKDKLRPVIFLAGLDDDSWCMREHPYRSSEATDVDVFPLEILVKQKEVRYAHSSVLPDCFDAKNKPLFRGA